MRRFIKRRASGKVFEPNPLNIGASCALWLDGQDVTSLIASGSNITAWNDKSGNGRNFFVGGSPQLDTTNLNGRRSAYVGGGSNYFQRNAAIVGKTSDMTLYIVHEHTNIASDQNLFNQYSSSSEANFNVEHFINNRTRMYNWPPGGYTIAPTYPSNGVPYIFSLRYDNDGTNKAQMNGEGIGTATAAPFTGGTITQTLLGTRKNPSIVRPFHGYLGEYVIFNGVLTDAQHLLMLKYLMNHWGI